MLYKTSIGIVNACAILSKFQLELANKVPIDETVTNKLNLIFLTLETVNVEILMCHED